MKRMNPVISLKRWRHTLSITAPTPVPHNGTPSAASSAHSSITTPTPTAKATPSNSAHCPRPGWMSAPLWPRAAGVSSPTLATPTPPSISAYCPPSAKLSTPFPPTKNYAMPSRSPPCTVSPCKCTNPRPAASTNSATISHHSLQATTP